MALTTKEKTALRRVYAKKPGVSGAKELQRAFKSVGLRHAKGLEIGLKRAGLFLQRESQKIVPIEFGVLRNSAFTRSEGSGFGTVVRVGYDASYAIYVHENLDASHKPGKQAKFLERPLREKRKQMADIIMESAERK